ncbi:luciferase [Microbacterium sp. CH12i]|uniref:LLM class flavin-dependent oxidoreductase n=1 Tax=Microbacterium sp. CH12i TaxID=1479651 RepID=UPI0004613B38|nr:LLM class flavin-dependent oxidoreductase [Microbacterium sp. CH12i]KDA05364.1 luciferase [Microbacterium sp. CH12i]
MEFGIYSFGDMYRDPSTGAAMNVGKRLRQAVEQIVLADQAGLTFFGVGERHVPEFAISSPTTVLAAAASLTTQIRLTSAVTVLSAEDPVRVYQQFATLDQLSGGRAEIIAGRGSFTEAFALFGAPLADYDELFDEKLSMLLAVDANEEVSWSGKYHAPLDHARVLPRAQGTADRPGHLPIWVGTGGNQRSSIRIGALGLPIVYGIIGGDTASFAPLVQLYRQAGASRGHDAASLKVGISATGLILDDGQQAKRELYPHFMSVINQRFGERSDADQHAFYDQAAAPAGALFVGSPNEVVDKILRVHDTFGNLRIGMQLDFGGIDPALTNRSIELLATEVIPKVNAALA